MKNVVLVASSTLFNSLLSLSPQIISLLTLTPLEFGKFSILYLIFAFGISLSLSVVSEPMLRGSADLRHSAKWQGYISTLVFLCLILAAVSLVVALFLGLGTLLSVGLAVAVFFGVSRSGVRYWQLHSRNISSVLYDDFTGVTALWLVYFLCTLINVDSFEALVLSWVFGNISSQLLRIKFFTFNVSGIRDWFMSYHRDIRALLRDSLLMDVGAIFSPLLLISFLSIGSFGTYRAISNVAAPVRLLLNPLRPLLASWNPDAPYKRALFRAGAVLIGVVFGVGAYSCLFLMHAFDLRVGVITSLYDLATVVGIFVGANFIGHFFYVRNRISASSNLLFFGRILQTAIMTGAPLVGAAFGGLTGAAWLLAIGTVISCLAWMLIDIVSSSEIEEE